MTTEQKIEELEKQLQELKNEIKPKFKKGDFVKSTKSDCILIFDEYENDYNFKSFIEDDRLKIKYGWIVDVFRLATESEKQQLIDKLRENGKDWDAEKCEVVDYRWRADEKGFYYYICYDMSVERDIENYYKSDDNCYKSGNYFKTEELAEKAAEKVKELLLTLKHS